MRTAWLKSALRCVDADSMRRLILLPVLLLAALPSTAMAAYPRAFGAVKGNPADALAKLPIERFSYDRATHCVKRPTPGALAFQGWLQRHARGVSWGIVRCEKWGKRSASLHAEGRALDWHLDVGKPADNREARRLISLMLAPDRQGRPAALARRMGIQEIIWDCMSWFGGGTRLGRYSACYAKNGKPRKIDPTTAHRNHIHFGLTRAGAAKRTSFWTHRAPKVSDTDFGSDNPDNDPEGGLDDYIVDEDGDGLPDDPADPLDDFDDGIGAADDLGDNAADDDGV